MALHDERYALRAHADASQHDARGPQSLERRCVMAAYIALRTHARHRRPLHRRDCTCTKSHVLIVRQQGVSLSKRVVQQHVQLFFYSTIRSTT